MRIWLALDNVPLDFKQVGCGRDLSYVSVACICAGLDDMCNALRFMWTLGLSPREFCTSAAHAGPGKVCFNSVASIQLSCLGLAPHWSRCKIRVYRYL